MKYLLWIGLFLIIYWIVRKSRNHRSREASPPARAPEEMVNCAHCGVYLPASESIEVDGRRYCCSEHQQAAQARDD